VVIPSSTVLHLLSFFTQFAFPDSKFASPSKKAPSGSMTIKIPIYTNITPPRLSSEKKIFSGVEIQKASYATETSKIPIELLSNHKTFPIFAPRIKDTTRADIIGSGIPPFPKLLEFSKRLALRALISSHLISSQECSPRCKLTSYTAARPLSRGSTAAAAAPSSAPAPASAAGPAAAST
jgi:hypothetical protein